MKRCIVQRDKKIPRQGYSFSPRHSWSTSKISTEVLANLENVEDLQHVTDQILQFCSNPLIC